MQINHPDTSHLTAQVIPIGHGRPAIEKTVRIMRDLARYYQHDPQMRAQALMITQLNPERDEPAEVGAIFNFVVNSIRYVGDVYDVETVQHPPETLLLRAGDCDDKTLLLVVLLRVIGYDAFFVVTGYTEPGVYEHIYAGVHPAPGADTYVPLDATERMGIGWEAPGAVAKYFEEVS